ncbi:Carbamoyl-phosphate synthase [Dimargaris xerosporica]|nr:Carbamoyl-phosphate synthase [Dimargaris xerosporica]
MVLGSGVYRIGSSVEFDWCAVRAIRTLRDNNMKTVMVNYNPETVSTDYDEVDRLYFENITLERALDIYDIERSSGVMISMGGQIPNNIALPLHRQNVRIMGTSPEMIDTAENRYKFSRLLDKLGVDQPSWKELSSFADAQKFCDKVGYPVLVRPSYVLSGAAMNVVFSPDDLASYLNEATAVSREHPVVITKYIEEAKEIEMDAVALDGELIMHVISEHVENAGVHSGDATLILPPQDLDPETVSKVEAATRKIANALNVTGPFNIQFIAKNNEIKVIECNVRAARSFPFVSKVKGVDLIEMATKAMLGVPVEPYPKSTNTPPSALPGAEAGPVVGIKVPQFSFSRLLGADPILGVEMASTGEVACMGRNKYEAYIKALLSTGFQLPKRNILLSIGSYKEKEELLPAVRSLRDRGFNIFATAGTADFMQQHGIPVKYLVTLDSQSGVGSNGNGGSNGGSSGGGNGPTATPGHVTPKGQGQALAADQLKHEYDLEQHLANNLIDLYINLPSKNRFRRPANYVSKGYRTRRMAVDFSVPLITNIKCAKLFIEALTYWRGLKVSSVDYISSHPSIVLPGLININNAMSAFTKTLKSQYLNLTTSAVASGITTLCINPVTTDECITSPSRLKDLQRAVSDFTMCDMVVATVATQTNLDQLKSIQNESPLLYLSFRDDSLIPKAEIPTVAPQFFQHWNPKGLIMTDAEGTDLASVLLLASLYNRPIHVTNVRTKRDITLIALSKQRGMKVTCDAPYLALFVEDLLKARNNNKMMVGDKTLPPDVAAGVSLEDCASLWEHLSYIDCISSGDAVRQICTEASRDFIAGFGLEDMVACLLTAVSERRMTVDDLRQRLYDNPRRILGIPEQPDTYIELELDRLSTVSPTGFRHSPAAWSPIAGREIRGVVNRVVLHGKLVYLDGNIFINNIQGEDLTDSVSPALAHDRSALGSVLTVDTTPKAVSGKSALPTTPRTTTAAADSSITKSTTRARRASLVVDSPTLEPAARHLGTVETLDGLAVAASGDGREGGPRHAQMQLIESLPRSISRIGVHSPFYRKHILSVRQFTRDELHILFGVAQEMRTMVERHGMINLLPGLIMCSMFFEPSTRTQCSFTTAMQRLGGSVVTADAMSSSMAKGESLADTIKTFGAYGNVVVLRHPEPGSVHMAAKYSPLPIINGGDGTGEHPTQAFLDVFTIREELGTVNGLTITLVGDLKNGRTAHSLVRVLAQYHVTLNYVSPSSLRMPDDVKADVAKLGIQQAEYEDLHSVIGSTDVLYVTRVQRERFADLAEYERLKDSYVINNAVLSHAKSNMIVMHPLPRVGEIDPEVDFDPRAAYFRQMKYGMYVRMALLALVLGKSV